MPPGGSEGLFAQKTLEITDDVMATYKNQGTISPHLPTLSLCSFFLPCPPFSIRAILAFLFFGRGSDLVFSLKVGMIYLDGQRIK